jgi:medium-chain acyl-[acyl-carrier-protein] hydrolase
MSTALAEATTFAATYKSNPWFGSFKPNPGARMRLFCFPYAGGAAAIYQGWPEQLPAAIEVCPVHLPGRGLRVNERAYTQVSDLVRDLTPAILPLLDKPYAFFGHSMGGLISFELARELRRQNAPAPAHIFISGRKAPQTPQLEKLIYNLPEHEFVETLLRLNGTPREILENKELMCIMIPLLRADFELCERYLYVDESPLDIPITAFGGIQDFDVDLAHLQAWSEQTTGSFVRRLLPGNHFFLHSQASLLLWLLSQALHRIIGDLQPQRS